MTLSGSGALPLVVSVGAAVGGTVLGRASPGVALPAGVGVAVLCVAVWVLRRRGTAALVAAVALVGLAAAVNAGIREAASGGRILPELAATGDSARVCGTVLAERPRSVEVMVRRAERGPDAWHVREPVRLAGEPIADVRAGERVCAAGTVRPPRADRREPPLIGVVSLESRGVGSPVRWAAAAVRERFRAAATAALPARQAGVLLGMTQGDRALLDADTLDAFRATGLAHLVAVSGFHVGIVVGLVAAAARILIPRGRWLRAGVTVPPLVFFAVLAGLSPSVLRATVSAGIVLVVVATGRTHEALRVACAAFLVLVFASPSLLLAPGFQMSFGATGGIILWAQRLRDWLAERMARAARRSEPGRLAQAVALLGATALAAQAGVAPLLAVHFGSIPATGGLANLLAVPVAPLIVGGGLLTLAAASVWSGLGWAPAALRLPIDLVLAVAERFAALPAANVGVDLLAAVGLTAGFAALLATRPPIRVALAALAVVSVAGTAGQAAALRPLSGCPGPEVRAVDVGGTAVLLRANDAAVLGDGGPAGGGIVEELRGASVDHLDAVVASHPHADHTEGLIEVLEAIPVGVVLAPPTIAWGAGADLVEAARRAEVPIVHTGAGDEWPVGEEITLQVVGPDDGPLPPEAPELINAYNLVVRAEIGGVRVLLPGDADGQSQAILAGRELAAPVLVAAHHGSADLDRDFVAAAAPEITVVTVGSDNEYGHPAARALRLYARHGPVFRTDEQGTILVCPVEGGLEVRTTR